MQKHKRDFNWGFFIIARHTIIVVCCDFLLPLILCSYRVTSPYKKVLWILYTAPFCRDHSMVKVPLNNSVHKGKHHYHYYYYCSDKLNTRNHQNTSKSSVSCFTQAFSSENLTFLVYSGFYYLFLIRLQVHPE